MVASGDAEHLQAMMNSCVRTDGAFHGKCSEWSLQWASELLSRCPGTVVLTAGTLPIAFQEVPTIRPPLAPLSPEASEAERARYETRNANRRRFHLTAAGVRTDLLSPAEAVTMFRRVLYYGFRAARSQGFEVGEGFFPWEHHPHMPRKWTAYPGCELVDAPSISPVDGRALYRLRWQLDDVIPALAAEGAASEALDVA
jgi:hypothetical protein